jgi:hypothetical protein
MLGFVLQGEQQTTDTRVLLAGASLATGFAACVLAARAGTRRARIRRRIPEFAHRDKSSTPPDQTLRALDAWSAGRRAMGRVRSGAAIVRTSRAVTAASRASCAGLGGA